MKYKSTITAAVLALALALPLAAQNSRFYRDGNAWVEETTGSLPAARNLRVEVETGAVTVQGGSQNDLRYTVRKRIFAASQEAARRALEPFRIAASRSGDAAVLEARWQGARAAKFTAEISLQVPRELGLVRVQNQGGTIAVRNIAGRVEAESGGGAMQLSDIAGGIKAETGGGGVQVANSAGELELSTGGGSIRISGSKGPVKAETGGGSIEVGDAAQLRLETGGGSIDVKQCNGDLMAETGGGSIDVGDVTGGAVLETGGGSIRLASAKGRVMASTGSGTIELYKLMQGARVQNGSGGITAELLGGGSDSVLETGHGDIVVYLSPQAKFTVRASVEMANGHKITSDFPELKITTEGGQWGPRNSYAEGNLNGGGPTLRVRTNLGNIEFRRAR